MSRRRNRPPEDLGFFKNTASAPRPRRRSRLLVIACLGLSLVAGGCGLLNRTKSLFGGKLPIQVFVASDVNQNSPVAVELVIVYNKKFLDKLLEMSAKDWFERRVQMARDFPKAFKSQAWEWVPGQEVDPIEMSVKRGARAGVAFADYFSAGPHRIQFDPHKPLRLELRDDEIYLEQD